MKAGEEVAREEESLAAREEQRARSEGRREKEGERTRNKCASPEARYLASINHPSES